MDTKAKKCFVCGKSFPDDELVKGTSIREQIEELITNDYPGWSGNKFICKKDLARYQEKYVDNILKDEKGSLSKLENDVVENLKKHELITENIEKQFDQKWTFGEKISDKIADFGGSWSFIILFGVFMAVWVLFNVGYLIFKPFDPYPFILLNLILSTLAAIQAPIIMMSQNRQEAKDRLRSQYDYKVNLKAEIEIKTLHEKMDHLLNQQWSQLANIQKVQMELLNDIIEKVEK